jgi:hypothetical protein
LLAASPAAAHPEFCSCDCRACCCQQTLAPSLLLLLLLFWGVLQPLLRVLRQLRQEAYAAEQQEVWLQLKDCQQQSPRHFLAFQQQQQLLPHGCADVEAAQQQQLQQQQQQVWLGCSLCA